MISKLIVTGISEMTTLISRQTLFYVQMEFLSYLSFGADTTNLTRTNSSNNENWQQWKFKVSVNQFENNGLHEMDDGM